MLHLYLLDHPHPRVGDKAACGHIYTREDARRKLRGSLQAKCHICKSVERSRKPT